MALKIRSTSEIGARGIKCVVYGASGTGKTVLCSTAPQPFIISAEQGLLSLARKDIPFAEVATIADIGEAYKYAKSNDSIETICLDSLSELAAVCLTQFKKEVSDGRQAYGKLAEAFGALIRNFRDIDDKNVVFVAKQRRVEDEELGLSYHEPYLPGRVLPFDLPYLVDEVLCLRIARNGDRYLQTAAERKYIAKDRSGKLDAAEPADLSAIFNKIRS